MTDSCASTHECPSVPPLCPSEKSLDKFWPCASEKLENSLDKSWPCLPEKEKLEKSVDKCVCPCEAVSQYSCIESVSSGFEQRRPKNLKKVDYRKAKLILKQPSSISGENLFDHLVKTIERVIDERPINVADYFEQYSRDVRKDKSRVPERLSLKPYIEPQFLLLSTAVMNSFKPPPHVFDLEVMFIEEEAIENVPDSQMTIYSESSFGKIERTLSPNENVLQLQHFWAFCGLGFQIDEIFQLSLSIQKILYHRIVRNARFWGRVYGLHGSYYIVEAMISKAEIENRLEIMKSNQLADMMAFINRRDQPPIINDDVSLIPGAQWQNFPAEDLDRMQPVAKVVPVLKIEEKFDALPETVGVGVNRRVYFVTTSLSGEWQELPIVTPKQIQVSKKIKKFFTGDLNASLNSYPLFPGTEKNYLRAMIARITAGTYIAPEGYYRRMTKKEIRDMEKDITEVDDENQELENEEEEEEEEVEEGEETYDNDALLIEDSTYEPIVLKDLTYPCAWFHVRPNILNQGRVLHVDEELAIRELEVKAQLIIKSSIVLGEGGEEGEHEEEEEQGEENEEDEEEEVQEEEEERPPPEEGPELFTPCDMDTNEEYAPPWIARYSSLYNRNNQMMLMRSNLWPGAYSFTFEKFCDSIYIGWGMKYVSRCISLEDAPDIENYDGPDIIFEATDPTPEMEEKWRLYHLKKETYAGEEMSDISVEFDIDDRGDEN